MDFHFVYTHLIGIIIFFFLAYILSELHDRFKKRYLMGASICFMFLVLFSAADMVLMLTEVITK